jgi:ubiquinone biosynthesis accessory factor UbiK
MNPTFLDDLSSRIKELLQQSPAKDLDKNLRALMSGAFARMDLVTREEFDIQKAVLSRTREKLSELETRLVELEKQVPGDRGSAKSMRKGP